MSDNAQHKMAFDALAFAFQMLEPHAPAYAALIEAERSMHGIMPITNPSLYIKAMNDKNLKRQVEMAKAAASFIAVVAEIRDELSKERDAATDKLVKDLCGF